MWAIKSDKIVLPDKLLQGYVYVDVDKIFAVTDEELPVETVLDKTGFYVAPGFIDMHTHGGGGYSFLGGSMDEVAAACDTHLRFGTTSIVPTISAAPFAKMQESLQSVAMVKRKKLAKSNVLGVHLEGPYLSPSQSGAQRAYFLSEPKKQEYESLLAAFPKEIVRWTYAPELDANGEFCRYITARGVLASAGHTDATYQDMRPAVDNGCRLVTHLYSCTSTVTRKDGFRRLGVVETAFLVDELYAELIADGKHLPIQLLQMILKIKGADKIVLVTDSLEIAGTDIKEGKQSGAAFIVEDGVCKLKDKTAFAGSIATANVLVHTLYHGCGVDMPTAVKMLTQNPAKLLQLSKGELAKNKDADIVVFDENICISDVFVGGERAV